MDMFFCIFDPVPPKCAIPDPAHIKIYAKSVSKQDSNAVSSHVEKSLIFRDFRQDSNLYTLLTGSKKII